MPGLGCSFTLSDQRVPIFPPPPILLLPANFELQVTGWSTEKKLFKQRHCFFSFSLTIQNWMLSSPSDTTIYKSVSWMKLFEAGWLALFEVRHQTVLLEQLHKVSTTQFFGEHSSSFCQICSVKIEEMMYHERILLNLNWSASPAHEGTHNFNHWMAPDCPLFLQT